MAEQASSQQLFRQAALDRLSSPDQIDRLVVVARPYDWSVLATLLALILIALAWGFFGSIATRVPGAGILINDGGQLFNATAAGDGTLIEMRVSPGDHVAKDQVLALISQDAIRHELANAEAILAERIEEDAALRRRIEDARKTHNEAAARDEERDLRDSRHELAEAERRRFDLRIELDQHSKVLSPTDGVVTEVKAAVGSRVTDSLPLVGIESGKPGLQLLLYVPPEHGKEIQSGMTVNIRPSTVKKEEYGTLLGKVAWVSDFPSTKLAMLATLQDDRLVQQFSAAGAPFALRIDLISDADGAGGYRWANGKGPPITLSSGTLADAEVVVRRQAPISLILPLFKKTVGL